MAWATPKTDWTADSCPTLTDFNRIETNSQYLYDKENADIASVIAKTRFGFNDLGANLASANNLPIVKDFHVVTGNTAIYYLSTTGYLPGARVILVFVGSLTLHHNEGVLADYAPLYLTKEDGSHGNISLTSPETTMEFIYDGTCWRQLGLFFTL